MDSAIEHMTGVGAPGFSTPDFGATLKIGARRFSNDSVIECNRWIESVSLVSCCETSRSGVETGEKFLALEEPE